MKLLMIVLLMLIIIIPVSLNAKMGSHPNCEDVEQIAEMYFQYPVTYKSIPDDFIFSISNTADCTMNHSLLYVNLDEDIFGAPSCSDLGDKKWSCNKGNVENSANFNDFLGAYYYYYSPCLPDNKKYTCEVRDLLLKYPEVVIDNVTREAFDIVISGTSSKAEGGWELDKINVSGTPCKIETAGKIKCNFPKKLVQNGQLSAKLIPKKINKFYLLMDIAVPPKDDSSETASAESTPSQSPSSCGSDPTAAACDVDGDRIFGASDVCPLDAETYQADNVSPVDGVKDGCPSSTLRSSSSAAPLSENAAPSTCSMMHGRSYGAHFTPVAFALFFIFVVALRFMFVRYAPIRAIILKRVEKRRRVS